MGSIYKDKSRGDYVYQVRTYFNTKNFGKKRTHQVRIGVFVKNNQTDDKPYLTTQQTEKIRQDQDKWFNDYDKNYIKKNIPKNPFKKPPTSLEMCIDNYIKDYQSKLDLREISPSTFRFNKENIRIFRNWYGTEYDVNKNIQQILPKHINEFKEHRTQIKRNYKPLSSQTIRINLRVVKGFFKWCVSKNYLIDSPFIDDIIIPTKQSRSVVNNDSIPKGMEYQDIKNFIENSLTHDPTFKFEKRLVPTRYKGKKLKEIKVRIRQKWDWFNENEWFKYMIWVILNSGVRQQEIRELKWEQTENDNFNITRTPYSYLDKGFTKMVIFSKGKEDDVPLNNNLKKMFRELYKKRDRNHIYVFTNPQTNKPYEKRYFNECFRKLMVGMGKVNKNEIPLYTPHSLRHGFVIDLIDNHNVKLTDVSKIVRHSSIRTTYDIYYSKDNKNLKSILDTL